jgi:hypothetical protein
MSRDQSTANAESPIGVRADAGKSVRRVAVEVLVLRLRIEVFESVRVFSGT